MNITSCYIIGGNDSIYSSFYKNIESLNRESFICNKVVIEIGSKLKSSTGITVYNEPNLINFNTSKKIGYKFWRLKYLAALKIDTDYGIYLDCDTVMANNNIEELLASIDDKIGVCAHFDVPTIKVFQMHCVPHTELEKFLDVKYKLDLNDDDIFYTGGVFIFKNNKENRNVFEDVLRVYDEIYNENTEYIKGITDELFFAACLKRYNRAYRLNGALNHCSMGNQHMPLKIENNTLYGKNSYETSWEKVSFLHCDTYRRDPSKNYEEPIKSYIKNCFEI